MHNSQINRIPLSEKRDCQKECVVDSRRFEHLLSKTSAKYINVSIDKMEGMVRDDFGRLAGLLGCDSCNFHMFDQEKQDWLTLFDSFEKNFMWTRHKKYARQLRELREQPDFAQKMQYMFEKWERGKYAMYPCPVRSSNEATLMGNFASAHGINSFLSVPIFAAGSGVGAIIVATHERTCIWTDRIIPMVRLFGEILANALLRKRSEESLRKALSEVKQLKDQIEADYAYLTEEINIEHGFPEVIGNSQALRRILVKVKQVAPTNATVLLLGETGTGKGVIAMAIHNESPRSHRPLIQVNCAALAPTLIESELFGHEKGAFTGATTRKAGRFEIANRTTLFLDEIGELPVDLQAKLLRVLHDGEFERLGGTTTLKTDVRVIAATNKDLQREVDKGNFRNDLWYRLSVFPIRVPPLRERVDDMTLLVNFFVKKYAKEFGKQFNKIPQKTLRAFQNYHWPGNIRELENSIERAVIACPAGDLRLEIPASANPKSLFAEKRKYQEFERKYLLDCLEKAGWKVEGPFGAASIAGLKPSTFRLHMKKFGIRRT